MNHWQRSGDGGWVPGQPRRHNLWLAMAVHQRPVAVNDVGMPQTGRGHGGCLGGSRCISGFGRARSLLPGHVLLGEALFSCLGFPIIVPDPSPVLDDPAPELPKHRFRGHDGDLARSVGIRQDFLGNQVILLRLCGDDLVQRPILVKQKVRVSVAQDPGTFRRQHEQFFPSIRNQERSAFVLPTS